MHASSSSPCIAVAKWNVIHILRMLCKLIIVACMFSVACGYFWVR